MRPYKNQYAKRSSQLGFGMAYAFAALAVMGTISVLGYSVYAGVTKSTSQSQNQTQSGALLSQAIAVLATETTDSDGDGFAEGTAQNTNGTKPTGGGTIPDASGAPKTDAWGSSIGYCTWDNGSTNISANRITGDSPGAQSSSVIAVVSSGADKTFQMTCADAKAGARKGDDGYRVLTVSQVNQGVGGTVFYHDPVDCENATTPSSDLLGNPAGCGTSTSRLDLLDTASLKDGQFIVVRKSGKPKQWHAASSTWKNLSGSATPPDAFSFTPVTDATTSTLYTSNAVTVTGIDSGTIISISGGEYQIDGGAWTSNMGIINPGSALAVRQTSSASFSTTTLVTVIIGNTQQSYSVTTLAQDTAPNAFSFTPASLTNVAANSVNPTNSITITGINSPAAVSASGTGTTQQCNTNGGGWGNCTGTISNNQTIAIRHTASATSNTSTTSILTVGGVSATFTVTTAVVSCPTGFILIPGSANYSFAGQTPAGGWCVMKYEASYYSTAGKTHDYFNGYCYATGCGVTVNGLGQIASNSGTWAINYISRDESETLCSSQLVNQTGATVSNGHVLPVGLWSKINRDIEQQPINWSQNAVGNFYLSRGCATSATSACGGYQGVTASSSNDTIANPTGYYSNRAWKLSTGEVIHDIAGNLWEWFYDLHNNGGNVAATWYSADNVQRTALGVSTTPSGTYALQAEADPGGHGFGYTYNAGVAAGTFAAIFGGTWYYTSGAGVFASFWSAYSSSADRGSSVGFRCVAPAQ